MSEPARSPAEAWTRRAHVVPLLVLAVYVAIGSRIGGPTGIALYRFGPPLVGLLAALSLAAALGWSLLRRPVLQPGRLLAFLSLGGALWMASFPLAYPSSHDGRPSAVRFRLPVEGEWRVRWGGDARASNALVLDPSERYGFHLVRVGAAGAGGEDTRASLGQPVLAPADGEVVRVERSTASALGAHLVLRVAPGEYLFLGGLDPASITAEPGTAVRAGDPLARVGAESGSRVSPGPHLSMHLQDTPEMGWGEAIPFRFRDLWVDGRRLDAAAPEGGLAGGRHLGHRVRNASEPAPGDSGSADHGGEGIALPDDS